jgi:tetratricopeptide (TPR) repeat protein
MKMSRGIIIILSIIFFGCSQSKTITKNDAVERNVLSESDNFEFQYAFIDANKQMMLGNYDLAKNLFLKCLKINNTDPAVYYKLATISLVEKNIDEALVYARSAVSFNKENQWYNVLLATLFEQKGEIDSAIHTLNYLKNNFPENPEYYIELAIINQNNKRYEEAINIYNEIESAFGISESISLEKEKLYIALGQRKEARKEIEKLMEFFPSDTRYIGILADYYMQEKNYEEAKKLYDKILSINPNNGIVRISLATYYFDKGDYEESFNNLEKAFENENVESAIKTNILLSVLEQKNKIKLNDYQIEKLTKIVIDKHPNDYNAHLLYSDILLQKQEYELAREELLLVSKEIKDKYILWEQLILVENQLLDFEGMFSTSKEAIEYFPNQAVLYLFNGISAIQIDKNNEAIESLNFGSKLVTSDDPQKVQFYTYLGEAYYNIKEKEKAFSYFEKVLEKEPDNMLILNNYGYYLGELDQDLEKAKEMSYKTVQKEPNNPTYLDTYAWILYKMTDYENAKIYIEKALSSGGITNETLMDHYGDILYKLGNIKEAKDAWNRALELGGDDKVKMKLSEVE